MSASPITVARAELVRRNNAAGELERIAHRLRQGAITLSGDGSAAFWLRSIADDLDVSTVELVEG
jgi:hypothetical protein